MSERYEVVIDRMRGRDMFPMLIGAKARLKHHRHEGCCRGVFLMVTMWHSL